MCSHAHLRLLHLVAAHAARDILIVIRVLGARIVSSALRRDDLLLSGRGRLLTPIELEKVDLADHGRQVGEAHRWAMREGLTAQAEGRLAAMLTPPPWRQEENLLWGAGEEALIMAIKDTAEPSSSIESSTLRV